MSTYKINSDRLSVGKKGETVSTHDLVGLNVDALISAGHLEPVSLTKKSDKKEQE